MNIRTFFLFPVLAAAIFNFGCGNEEAARVNASGTEFGDAASTDPQMQKARELIDKSPNSPAGYVRLAMIFAKQARQTGDFSLNSKAEAAINRALEADPKDISARKLRASLYLTFHRFSDALKLGTELQKEFPADAFVYGVLTDANAELGNYDQAVDAVQRMVDLKPNTASYARAAHIRSLYGDHEGAVEMFKTAARSADPTDRETQSWCLVQLGDELWKNGKFAEAEKVYDEALTNFPNYYLAVAAKGKIRAARGDLAGAETLLAEAQNRVPNVDVIILLGEVYTLLGNTEKADQQERLLMAVEEKLGLAGDRRQLALFLADRDIRLGEALAIAERRYAVSKDIYTADIYAWSLYKNGRFAEAKKIIGQALRLNTNDARILYHAGMIDAALGDKTSSRKYLSAALKLNPAFDLIQARAAKAELEK